MGIFLSCLHHSVLNEGILAFLSSLVDYGRWRTTSATARTPILMALGSGKKLIERSLSLNKSEFDKMDGLVRKASFNLNSKKKVPDVNVPQPPDSPKHEAAIKLQKVYKSFRTRRQLADCAVLVEQRWWKLLDLALLERNSVSFFDDDRTETAASRWVRGMMRAAKVGKGVLKDAKARKLALQHWLEAIDPRHRYGHNLHFYYLSWLQCDSKQPFFYWLDVGDGKEVNLHHCPRSKLQQQCIKYLCPKGREPYEIIVDDGKLIYKQSRQLLDTSGDAKGSKWIFVLSTSKQLYVGQKKKGRFQHSSFLAGAATSSAGRLVVERGIPKAVWPHSGHYHPTEENFLEFMSFLRENKVDLSNVKNSPIKDDDDSWDSRSASSSRLQRMSSAETVQEHAYSSQGDTLSAVNGDTCSIIDESMQCFFTESKPACDDTNAIIFKRTEEETDEETDENAAGNIGTSQVSDSPITPMDISHHENANGSNDMEEKTSPSMHRYIFHKKNLFEEDPDEDHEQKIPKELILRRINSIERKKPLQLGRHWTSGVGPRIGCVRDYPLEVQVRALEKVSLSPRSTCHSPSASFTPRTTACSTLMTTLSSSIKTS